jgi:hypothetical protein
MGDPDPSALLKAYELAHVDHRAEVALVWDRQKFFLSLNPAILAAAGAVAAFWKLAAVAVLGVGTATCIIGALTVAVSHARTRNTRNSLEAAARLVGVQGPEITGGQQELHGKKRKQRYRVVTLVILALSLNAIFDAALAVYLGCDQAWPSVSAGPRLLDR